MYWLYGKKMYWTYGNLNLNLNLGMVLNRVKIWWENSSWKRGEKINKEQDENETSSNI